MTRLISLVLISVAATTGVAFAQGVPPGQRAPEDPEQQAIRLAFNKHMEVSPDLPGTGPYLAIKRVDKWFPDHVLYRPADIGALRGEKLPIVLWGNGGCINDGASGRHHLLEIASHGYIAIAPGPIMSGPGSPPEELRPKMGAPGSSTTWQQVDAGLDLAAKANNDPKSPYYQRLDLTKVAVAGHSCGGLQALNVALNDQRIKTLMLHNSGLIIGAPGGGIAGGVTKDSLEKIRIPTIYILGGPKDIAYANGMDDFKRINNALIMVANIDTGHQATFADTNGGVVAQVSVDWLNWQLKGDKRASQRFVGAKCGLCTDREWTVESKNWK